MPFRQGVANRFLKNKRSRWRTTGVILFGCIVVVAIYLVSVRVITYFHAQNDLGVILSLKIFEMAWMIIFAMLVFSSMVSGVSTLFLSRDNEIIFAAPVPPEPLFFMRYVTTSIYTAWMMVVFSLPVFGAYGVVFNAGMAYWPLMVLAVFSMAATASGFGLAATVLLVNLFPARRTRDIVAYLSLLGGILLYLFIRLMRPEALVDPDRFPDFIEYLSALSAPTAPILPAGWASNMLTLFLQDQRIDWLLCALLVVTPVVFFILGEIIMKRLFFKGFSRAQESFGGFRTFTAPAYHSSRLRWFLHKETKLFLRDSAEWSQLFMIGALVLVYLYNFKVLPLDRAPMSTAHLANLIGYANIGLAGFLVVSLCARFVFPSIGMEKEAFDLLRAAPLSLRRYLFYKYLFYVVPFTLFTLVLLTASNHLLKIEGPMQWISLVAGLLITWSVVGTALGFGARYADFKTENRAAALGGFGAIVFLFTALSVTLVIISLGGFPAYRLVRHWLAGMTMSTSDWWLTGSSLFAMVATAVAVPWVCLKKGLKRLE
jgi:ABC-2 type transport system permease protein